MAITKQVEYHGTNGPEGRLDTGNPHEMGTAINESGETIAYGRIAALVSGTNGTQLNYNPSMRPLAVGDTQALKLTVNMYNERNENANYGSGDFRQFLDTNGDRGTPDGYPGQALRRGSFWACTEVEVTDINQPVFARVDVSASDPTLTRIGRVRTDDDGGTAIDVSDKFYWINGATAGSVIRLMFKGN